MSTATLVLTGVVAFILGYIFYGGYVARLVELDPNKKTPAHTLTDGVDYVPAKAPVLLGHHFASIAGGGPIVGPIKGAMFGWLPAAIWIVLGSIFIGGVHDFMSLISSARHDGKSIGEVINEHIGKSAKTYFLIFVWAALVLVIAVFTILVAKTFAAVPAAATASILFMIIALFMGYFLYQKGASLGMVTVVAVILLFLSIWIGIVAPFHLSMKAWIWVLIVYIVVASVTPVWVLLQPRDYLNSFLLYTALIGGFIGILVGHPAISYPAFIGFNIKGATLFPLLFVIIACGAISGFHSLVASGTTSKQLDKETDAKMIGYGGMLIEGVLALIATATVAILTKEAYAQSLGSGGPVALFSRGLGQFLGYLGIPQKIGVTFGSLTVSAFLLTSLDTATRLGRYAFEELFSGMPALSNRYTATGVTVIAGGALALSGKWSTIWPVFGASNQLLAGLALLSATVWLAHSKKSNWVAFWPMIFMFIVTLSALVLLAVNNFKKGNAMLGTVSLILLLLAVFMIIEALIKKKPQEA